MRLSRTLWTSLLLLSAPAREPVELDFSLLAGFDYVEGMRLPPDIMRHDEAKVIVSGFMRAESTIDPATGEEVEFFMLVNDGCGCEGTPKMNEIVFCAMPEGKTTELQPGIVKVTGKFFAGELKEDGVVIALYTLDVDDIEATQHNG